LRKWVIRHGRSGTEPVFPMCAGGQNVRRYNGKIGRCQPHECAKHILRPVPALNESINAAALLTDSARLKRNLRKKIPQKVRDLFYFASGF
jgi:hypothetical protein